MGDVEARRGLTSVSRPAFRSLFDSRPEGDILLQLTGSAESWDDYVSGRWRAAGADIEEQAVLETQRRPVRTSLRAAATADRISGSWPSDALEEPALIYAPSVRFLNDLIDRAQDGRMHAVE